MHVQVTKLKLCNFNDSAWVSVFTFAFRTDTAQYKIMVIFRITI